MSRVERKKWAMLTTGEGPLCGSETTLCPALHLLHLHGGRTARCPCPSSQGSCCSMPTTTAAGPLNLAPTLLWQLTEHSSCTGRAWLLLPGPASWAHGYL